MGPLRLMVYDRTCTTGLGPGGLTHTWIVGAKLYGALGRLDAWTGASSWAEALDWLGTVQPDRPIAEVQYWGHGNWGRARIAKDVLDVGSLSSGHGHRPQLERIRERMGPGSSWWFRTCDTFGSARGHRFAQEWTTFFGCSAAGFTHIIGPWQSGLHRLSPGDAPHWSASEGVAEGTAEAPKRSTWSSPRRPNTVTCLAGVVPDGW